MNVRAYIESGILEAYVLGALSEEERAGVEAHIALHPEIAAEVAAIEESMLGYARLNAEEPPAALQDQIWAALKQQPVVSGNNTRRPQRPQTVPLGRRERSRQIRWQRAAVWIALVGSLLANMLLWMQRNGQEEDRLVMQQQIDSLSRQQQQLGALVHDYEKARNMLLDTNMHMVVMRSMKPGEQMGGMVFFDKQKGDLYLTLHHMPAPPSGRQYQLWVIRDGKPVDMGVIPNDMVNSGGMEKMQKPLTGGETFAISLEQEGGSPRPTMEQVQVMGKAS